MLGGDVQDFLGCGRASRFEFPYGDGGGAAAELCCVLKGRTRADGAREGGEEGVARATDVDFPSNVNCGDVGAYAVFADDAALLAVGDDDRLACLFLQRGGRLHKLG